MPDWIITKIYALLRLMKKPYVAIIALFLIVLGFALALNNNKSMLVESAIHLPIINLKIGPVSESFYTSFLASLWQDIFFFFTLGLFTLILFYRDPRSDEISTKIWYIYPGRFRSKWAIDYKEKIVRKLGCYSKSTRVRIQITEYSERLKAFRVRVTYNSILVNAFKSDPYEDELKVSFLPDQVNVPAGELIGEIEYLKIGRYQGERFLGTDDILENPISYSEYKREDWHTFPFNIAADERVDYDYSYWQWAKVNEPFVLGLLRFCRELDVVVSTSCPNGEIVEFDVSYPDKNVSGNWRDDESAHQIGDTRESHSISPEPRNVEPGQRIVLKFRPGASSGSAQHRVRADQPEVNPRPANLVVDSGDK